MLSQIHIGTSGWQYDHWREPFYGTTRKQDWLSFYAARFNSVEINSTFYRLQSSKTLTRWCHLTPEAFAFTMKANRYLTHSKRLLSPLEPVLRERDNAKPLRHKLKVVLWQLPASLNCNIQRLEDFLKALHRWRSVFHVIEFRHQSWFTPEVAQLLESRHVGVCISDAADWPRWDKVTGNLVYIRLHGKPQTYVSAYSPAKLEKWINKIHAWSKQDKEIYLFFDNDGDANAIRNALSMKL